VPFATLAAMTFPSILTSTDMLLSALTGFVTALILAFAKKSLIVVAIGASLAVLIVEALAGIL
jgi:uncharacterized membrane protein